MSAEVMKTGAAARFLAVPPYILGQLVNFGKIPRPAMDSGGQHVWTPRDLAAAKAVLDKRAARRARREHKA
jgi:hypothetical protein